MRTRLDTTGTRFRAAGQARRKQIKGQDACTRDGRPVWLVRLTAIEADRNSAETIWVEVAGDVPELTIDAEVEPTGLAYIPWVNRAGKLVRWFAAAQVTPLDLPSRKSA